MVHNTILYPCVSTYTVKNEYESTPPSVLLSMSSPTVGDHPTTPFGTRSSLWSYSGSQIPSEGLSRLRTQNKISYSSSNYRLLS